MTEKRENEYNCKKCNDIGWLRQDLDVFDEGFGRLVRCPDCNPEDVIIPDPEPEDEPETIQEEFDWQKWTE